MITRGVKISTLCYAVLHFITYFYQYKFLVDLQSISGFLILFFAAFVFPVKKFKLPLSLFLIGMIVLIVSDTPIIEGLLNGFLQMRNIIGLLVVVPIISWVLTEESYIPSMIKFSQQLLNSSRKMYFGIMTFTQIIAYFLLFGAIPMIYQFLNMVLKHEKGEVWEHFKGTAILRGFALSVMWVVSIPSYIFAIEAVNATLWKAILQGLGAASIGIFIALIFSHYEEKRYKADLSASLKREIADLIEQVGEEKGKNRLAIEFMVLCVTFLGLIFSLNAILPLNLMMLIPLIIIGWTISYYVLKRRVGSFIKQVRIHYNKSLVQESFQISVMLGAGFLIYALNQTNFAENVINGIYSMQEMFPLINLLYLLPLMVIILGFAGLGPLTVMVLVGGILENLNLPYPPELIVLAISSGSAISILLSPMIMPIIVLSNLNGLSGFKNGIKFNLLYALVLYTIVQIYVQGMLYFY